MIYEAAWMAKAAVPQNREEIRFVFARGSAIA